MKVRLWSLLVLAGLTGLPAGGARAAGESNGLRVGCSTIDLTPPRPVALDGQFATRISRGVDNPLTASAVALESREGDRPADGAVLVSCDIVAFRPVVVTLLRDRLREKLPDVDPRKVILTATHTHTAPATEEGKYTVPKDGVMPPSEYASFLADRLVELVACAWTNRRPGGVSWALGHAVVGQNRRAVYANGKAQMYGSPANADFRGLEGGEDHALELLYFWDQDRNPLAVCVNVECTAQEVESRSTVNADFWHDVRSQLRTGAMSNLCVLGWPGAAGDLSPRRMYRKAAEERMLKLRGLTYTEEVGRRISREVLDVLEFARRDIRFEVPFAHRIADLALPVRKVTDAELAEAKTQAEALAQKGDTGSRGRWFQRTIDRHETQDKEPTFDAEVHVLRIGDIAIATNPFELFHDYGVQMKGRSRALQTFVIELTCGSGGYLPTKRAVEGGGYSAVVQSNRVGPEGGQVLVDETLKTIHELFP